MEIKAKSVKWVHIFKFLPFCPICQQFKKTSMFEQKKKVNWNLVQTSGFCAKELKAGCENDRKEKESHI